MAPHKETASASLRDQSIVVMMLINGMKNIPPRKVVRLMMMNTRETGPNACILRSRDLEI